ncbi:hypothetical protein AWW66_13835 [Micromonospora rosaria]|uniref:DUF3558 domain-containing protein n=1 Tax=Micromonospora rosaria TaxID=47874 RepID=A0A136PSK1_9ACTN|nr:hypothetical protein AWW66_13835 [Micromonospora rosaria]
MRRGTRRAALGLVTPAVVALAVLGLAGCGGPGAAVPSGAGEPPAPSVERPAEPGAEPSAEPGGDPGEPTGGAVPEACALVDQREAEQLAGTALNEPVPVRETCTYTGPVDGPTAQVEVFVGDGAAKFLGIERELGHELRPLAGVGDEAYATQEAVFVHKSGVWVSVRLVRLNDPAENRAPLERIARTVATRL